LSLWAFFLVPDGRVTHLHICQAQPRTLFRRQEKGVALFDALLQLLHGVRVIKIYQGERRKRNEPLNVRASILTE
jgi:hypothetical protein